MLAALNNAVIMTFKAGILPIVFNGLKTRITLNADKLILLSE